MTILKEFCINDTVFENFETVTLENTDEMLTEFEKIALKPEDVDLK